VSLIIPLHFMEMAQDLLTLPNLAKRKVLQHVGTQNYLPFVLQHPGLPHLHMQGHNLPPQQEECLGPRVSYLNLLIQHWENTLFTWPWPTSWLQEKTLQWLSFWACHIHNVGRGSWSDSNSVVYLRQVDREK
jgi:hypothetical protein